MCIALTTVVAFSIVATLAGLTAVYRSLRALQRKVECLMSSEQDLQNDLDAIVTAVATVAAKQAAQAKSIADLQAQLAAGTPVSQAQLDALVVEADSIKASLQAVVPPAV
jgi:peptidoglycan hydrolase CwlO-like protein